ncbi:MAG TPA: TRAM domain-containing protein [Nitrososphaerales archaeon]|nr:TRAM domain-containing protein [Nitrososphaerales archaeon]
MSGHQQTRRRVARVEGYVVLVPGTKQGQNVRIEITQVSQRFASAQVVETSQATAAPESAEGS